MIGIRRNLASSAAGAARPAWTGPALLLVPRHEDLLVIAPDGTTHVVPRVAAELAGFGKAERGAGAGPDADSSRLLALLEQLRGGKRGRVRQAVLVLPRFQHLFRRFSLPPCSPAHLASVIRYQIDLHTNLGADEACFDFYPLDPRGEEQLDPSRRRARFEALNAGDDDVPSLGFAAEVTSLAAIEPYRVLLEKAGLSLATVTTRSQIYVRRLVSAAGSDATAGQEEANRGGDAVATLLVVRDDCGTEVLLERHGRLAATAYVEQLPGETLEAEDLIAAIQHVRGALEERVSIRRVVVWGAEESGDGPILRRVLADELPEATVQFGAAPLESQLAIVAGDPMLAGELNLLRSTVVTDPSEAPRRRRVRAGLAAALVLAGACWLADSRLREMDQRIATLAADVAAAQQQIERGDRTDKTHEAIAARWRNRQEWIPALDAVFRPMEEEDAVELAMLNADGNRGDGESEFVLSGTAPDSTVVPRLLARYAQDKSIVEVSPLGIRPQRNQDGEGVQFDLRVVRKAGPGSRE